MTPGPGPTVPVAYVAFRESATPITAPVTKFGGQPAWLETPRWPVSAADGRPMHFVAQVALESRLFGGALAARMAYLFLAEHELDWTRWKGPGGGAPGTYGALVLQPGPADYAHVPDERGPTLVRRVVHREGFLGWRRRHEELPCEYAAELTYSAEPTLDALNALAEVDEEAFEQATDERFERTKVGGTPSFIQNDEFPFEPPCALVLQLATYYDTPFHIALGDAGTLYAFTDARGERGGIVVQTH